MNERARRLKPLEMIGTSFNVVDQEKFELALKLLRECTGEVPLSATDNLITWNRNLSFMHEDYFLDLWNGDELDFVEKSCMWRLYVLLHFAEICDHLEGDFVELGCHKGSTAKRVTEKVDFIKSGKHYWLYDLFAWNEGDEHSHMPGHDNPNMFEDVVNRFSDQSYVSVIKGPVPKSFEQGFPDKVAFAHIDMNHPAPEAAALQEVLPRLASGGCIIFDDYGWWSYSAQKLALDPIVDQYGLKILELPTGQGLLINR